MHEFIPVHLHQHPATRMFSNPNITVHNPHHIPPPPHRLSIRTTHIPDLRVRTQLQPSTLQQCIFLLDQNLRIEDRKIADELFEDGKGGIIAAGDADADVQFVEGVELAEGGGEAGVEGGVEAGDGADDGDVGAGGGVRGGDVFWGGGVVAPSEMFVREWCGMGGWGGLWCIHLDIAYCADYGDRDVPD